MQSPALVLGDIHGDAKNFRKILDYVIKTYPDIRIFAVGDFIDRGSGSHYVLEWCADYNVQGVLGNHDLWLYDVFHGLDVDTMIYSKIMGGNATLNSYGVQKGDATRMANELRSKIPEKVKNWVKGLKAFRVFQVGNQNYIITHTGIKKKYEQDSCEKTIKAALAKPSPEFFWVGADPENETALAKIPGYTQIFGHTPIRDIKIAKDHYIALDTGCSTVDPWMLSGVILFPDGKVEKIQSKK